MFGGFAGGLFAGSLGRDAAVDAGGVAGGEWRGGGLDDDSASAGVA